MALPDESDLVVVIWENRNSAAGRPFQTISKHGSQLPVAWRLSYLRTKYLAMLPDAHLVESVQELAEWSKPPLLHETSRERPLLVPVRFVRIHLGWDKYDIWDSDLDD